MCVIHIHRHTGILFSLKKDLSTCDNKDESGGHYAKGNKSDTKTQILHNFNCMETLNSQTHKRREQNGDCQRLNKG